jgi:glycosyltransferase involved in cell wall biosynthesis
VLGARIMYLLIVNFMVILTSIFLGAQDVNRLPEYIKAFDVCINPQLLNETTKRNYPRKIDEYLAMGKPVVATKTIAMGYFKDWVYLAETKEVI